MELDGSARSKCHVGAFIVAHISSVLHFELLFTKTKRLTTVGQSVSSFVLVISSSSFSSIPFAAIVPIEHSKSFYVAFVAVY